MNAFELRERLVDDYLRYTKSFLHISDERIKAMVDGALSDGAFWPDPLLQLNPTFVPGGTMDELVDQGVLQEGCRRIFRVDKGPEDPVGRELFLHRHQREAIFKARDGQSYVLTSGTGSGKSLAYIVPIVDHVLRRGSGKGIQAIIVYPMNALANSQEEELSKFLEHGVGDDGPPVRFARFTGQEKEDARRALREDPPDVLLTNYMMLELLLMRHEDRQIVRASQGLRFLVFDELHTYRGRQGADVAMLIRRCREAFAAHDAICVGTSATMASGGGSEAAKVAVAEVARTLFGIPFGAEQVIHESLERATHEADEHDPVVRDRLRRVVLVDEDPPTEATEFAAHPLSSWIESTFGVRQEVGTGRFVRQVPRRLTGGFREGHIGAAHQLAWLTGTDEEACARVLKRFLIAGSRLRRDLTSRYPVFAFRLHQFLTRGDTVWATLELPDERHLELSKKVSKPGAPHARLFPLVFCRNCGTEYYRVSIVDADGGNILEPREDRWFDTDHGEDGYLSISDAHPWPREKRSPELLRRLPRSDESLKKAFGIDSFLKNVEGVEMLRQQLFEPTCTIAGIGSGYQGPGSKTVLPAEAMAKVDFRIVPDQEPDDLVAKLRTHLRELGFGDIEVIQHGGSRAARVDSDEPFVQMVIETAREVYGKEPVVSPTSGGSGPMDPFVRLLNVPISNVGIGYANTLVHSPNENMRISDFVKGAKQTARVMARVGQGG